MIRPCEGNLENIFSMFLLVSFQCALSALFFFPRSGGCSYSFFLSAAIHIFLFFKYNSTTLVFLLFLSSTCFCFLLPALVLFFLGYARIFVMFPVAEVGDAHPLLPIVSHSMLVAGGLRIYRNNI